MTSSQAEAGAPTARAVDRRCAALSEGFGIARPPPIDSSSSLDYTILLHEDARDQQRRPLRRGARTQPADHGTRCDRRRCGALAIHPFTHLPIRSDRSLTVPLEFFRDAGAAEFKDRFTQFVQPQRPRKLAKSGKTGRNDPCPCGSGKKFKKRGPRVHHAALVVPPICVSTEVNNTHHPSTITRMPQLSGATACGWPAGTMQTSPARTCTT
jgi:SEC-C motif